MMELQKQVGTKWLAGVLLALLVLSMGSGFATPAYAEDVPSDTPSDTPSEEVQSDPAPEQTQEDNTNSETQDTTVVEDPGTDGTDGTDGTPTDDTTPAEDGTDGTQSEDATSGDNGNNGDSPAEEQTPDGEPATIETGDATSSASSVGSANTTSVNTNAPEATSTASTTPASDNSDSNASSTPSGGSNATSTPSGGGGPTDLTIGSGLTASTTASSTAETGNNTGVDPDGVNIFTGDGISSVFDVLTFNIALVNSFGQIVLLQNPLAEQLDLRSRILDVFQQLTGERGTCTLTVCEATNAIFNYIGDNISDVERNTYAGCNSGENVGTSTDGITLIDTGNCTSSNLTVTIGNLTAVQSKYLIILMNQVGDLSGDIILPEANFFEGLRGGASLGGNSSLVSDATVDATTNGTSTAETGGNTAVGDAAAAIDSGDANAHALVANYANQINPPTCFIISVGGTWTGDVYQMPAGYDRVHAPFGDVICGRGTGESDPVSNFHATTTNYAKVLVNAIAEATTGNNTAAGQYAGIRSGDADSFLYVLNLLNTTLISQDWLFGLFTVSGDWDGDFVFGARPDASPAEQAASKITSNTSSGKRAASTRLHQPSLTLTKTASVDTATVPATVDYTLTLKNNSNQRVYSGLLEDVLTDPTGKVVNTQSWDLGMIKEKEEITVSYTVEFSGNLLGGEYVNAARLTGHLGQTSSSPQLQPVFAHSSINLSAGEVLGAQDCPAYLSDYISPYGNNDPEQVKLLETFLRDGRGEDITPDGVYDAASIAAVKRFQAENQNDILDPWGIDYPTGYVYFTTRKKINELYCNGEKNFPLSPLQINKIQLFRDGTPEPGTENDVGAAPTTPWSAIDFPVISHLDLFPQTSASEKTAPATTPTLFSASLFGSHPLVSLLRDIFGGLAAGFSVERAQAAQIR